MRSKRNNFSRETKRQAWERAHGMCEWFRLNDAMVPGFEGFRVPCIADLGPVGNIFYEHIIPDRMGGKPTLDNCAVLCRNCWKIKTAKYDQPKVAKTRRQEDMARGIR